MEAQGSAVGLTVGVAVGLTVGAAVVFKHELAAPFLIYDSGQTKFSDCFLRLFLFLYYSFLIFSSIHFYWNNICSVEVLNMNENS